MTSLETALRLRELGFSVIPLRPGSKQPAIAWSDMQRMAPAPATIQLWYSDPEDSRSGAQGPNANVGVVIGAISDCIAIDWEAPFENDTPDQIDAKTRGQNILQRIGVWDRPHVVTGRGGRHFYGKFDPRLSNGTVRNAGGFPLFDTKTTGTQLVAPGSSTATGAQYVGDIEEIAKREPFPEALFALIAEQHGDNPQSTE